MQTPQDGVIGLVVFAKVFKQPLTNFLKHTKRSRRYSRTACTNICPLVANVSG